MNQRDIIMLMSHYVCTDLHGDLARFERFRALLNDDDVVFYLGDAIDRGSGGIEILSTIRNDPRFTMIMGNHEYMMFNFIKATMDNRIDEALECGKLWMIYNSGEVTFDAFKTLDSFQQEDLINYINSLPVQLNLEVNGRHFLLVHSHPICDGKDVWFKSIPSSLVERAVWDRVRNPIDGCIEGKITLAGHTIINPYGINEIAISDDIGTTGYIDLDCGCALQNENGRLGVLCLENLSVRYF